MALTSMRDGSLSAGAGSSRLTPLMRQALLWSSLLLAAVVVGIVGAKLNVILIAGLGIAIVGASIVLVYPALSLVGLWILSFGMLPAVVIPGPVQDQMRNLIEVGLLGMAALLAARAFFDEKVSISDGSCWWWRRSSSASGLGGWSPSSSPSLRSFRWRCCCRPPRAA